MYPIQHTQHNNNMPRTRRVAKRATKKRRPARRRRSAAPTRFSRSARQGTGMVRLYSADPFPPRYRVKLTYGNVTALSGNGTGNVFGAQVTYKLNSLFDPNATTGSKKPQGFSQLAALYNRYKVHGVWIEFTFQNTAGNSGTLCAVVVPSTVTVPVFSTANVDAVLGNQQAMAWAVGAQDGANSVAKYRQYFPMYAVEGISKLMFDSQVDDAWSSLVNTNPTANPLFCIAFAGSLTAAANGMLNMKMTFDAEFWERNVLAETS